MVEEQGTNVVPKPVGPAPSWGVQSFTLRLVQYIPFTLVFATLVLIVSAVTGLLDRPMTSDQLARWGFGWEDLADGALWRLLSAPLFILHPYMLLSIMAILLFFVGACEMLLKTRRTVLVFAVTHVTGYVGAPLLLNALGRAGWSAAALLLEHRDVGASNGAFGAAGAMVVFLPGSLGTNALFLLSAYLLGALFLEHRIWDVQHVIAFTTGLGLGILFLRRDSKRLAGLKLSRDILHRQRPLLMSWLVAGIGLVNALAAGMLPHHAGLERLRELLPFDTPHAPRMLLLFTGLLLLAVAGALRRAQRAAWWTALFLLLLTLMLQVHAGITKIEAVFALAFLIMMVAWKEDFPAPSAPPPLRTVRLTALSFALLVLFGSWLATLAMRGQFSGFAGPIPAAVDVLRRLAYMRPLSLEPATTRGAWLLAAIPLVFWTGLLVEIVLVLRAARAPRPRESESMVARRLALEYGRSGTAFMASGRGNSLFFSHGNRAFLAYRVHAGTAVALGDPVGEPGERTYVIEEFTRFCEERGWSLAILAATQGEKTTYTNLGFQLLQIGEEAVLELGHVEFKGKQWQNMRSALNRARREGIEFRMYEGGRVPPGIEEQMHEIERDWQRLQDLPLLEFTQGRVEDIRDPAIEVAVALDGAGVVHGYVDWLPIAAERGWVIDLMRRRSGAMQGTMEFLIGMSMLTFQGQGTRFLSLAAAPLADLDRGDEQSIAPRLLGILFERFQTFYNFHSLFDFKDRFEPRWEPVYLAYRDPTSLPTIGLAILRAHLPHLGWAKLTQLLGDALVKKLRSSE